MKKILPVFLFFAVFAFLFYSCGYKKNCSESFVRFAFHQKSSIIGILEEKHICYNEIYKVKDGDILLENINTVNYEVYQLFSNRNPEEFYIIIASNGDNMFKALLDKEKNLVYGVLDNDIMYNMA